MAEGSMTPNDVVTSLSDDTSEKLQELLNKAIPNPNATRVDPLEKLNEDLEKKDISLESDEESNLSDDEIADKFKEKSESPEKAKKKREHLGKYQRDNYNLLQYSSELEMQNKMLQKNLIEEKLLNHEAAAAQLEDEENTCIYARQLARQEGKIQEEVKIEKKLQEIAMTRLQLINSYKEYKAYADNLEYETQQYYNSKPQYNVSKNDIDDNVSDEYSEWVEKNPWLDRNSRNYDDKLYKESLKIGEELSSEYKILGKAAQIGSKEFLEKISNTIKNKYVKNKNASVVSYSSNITPKSMTHISETEKVFFNNLIDSSGGRGLTDKQRLDQIRVMKRQMLEEQAATDRKLRRGL
jgi:hypothetical protein